MILVYGGAFNPPTKAHKIIFETLMKTYQPSLFIFIPVGKAYPKAQLVDFHHRKAMLELLSANHPNVLISDFEQSDAFKGTISALDYFKHLYQTEVKFVLGLDNVLDLPNWIEYPRLMAENQFIAIDRQGSVSSIIAQQYPEHQHQFETIELDIPVSSTLFRQDPKSFKHLIDEPVYDYIQKHHLYGV
jgi:nicotinate-nucleotide adenylyltransferase